MQLILKDKNFYKVMLGIALPIVLQNLISSSLNMVDTLMITSLGEASIAAVGLANQVFFFFVLILFGINSGSSIFVAQFWGKRDVKNIRRILGIALMIGGALSIIFAASAFFMPKAIMRIFTKDIEVVELGVKYLRIVSISYLLTAVSFSFSVASRSIGQAKVPMIVSAIALLVNTLFNYLLIFGKLGFPQMGIEGAALATLISRIIEMVLILFITYSSRNALAAKPRELLDISASFLAKFFKTTTPVILNEFFWSLGMVMYSIAYARIGKEATATVQISTTIQNIFMVVSMGLANACAVMIGNKIGADNKEEGITYAKTFSVLGPTIGIILGILLYFLSPIILLLFDKLSPEVYYSARRMLIVISVTMSIRTFNAILIVGILRSGGDTKFSMFLEMGSVWLVGVPLAFLGALVFKLPVYWVLAMVSLEEVVKATIGIPRLLSMKWVRNVVEHM